MQTKGFFQFVKNKYFKKNQKYLSYYGSTAIINNYITFSMRGSVIFLLFKSLSFGTKWAVFKLHDLQMFGLKLNKY